MYYFYIYFYYYAKDAIPRIVGHCKCNHGYYGEACRNECPGGGTNPCFGKGTCDTVSGVCTCDIGADQNNTCQSCLSGWFGSDCKLPLSTRSKCKIRLNRKDDFKRTLIS